MKKNIFLLIDKFLGKNHILVNNINLELDLLSLANINIYNIFKTLSKYITNIDIYDISESNLNELPKTFIATNKQNTPVIVCKKSNRLFIDEVEISAEVLEPYIIASSQKRSFIKYLFKKYSSQIFIFVGVSLLILFLWINLLSMNQKLFMILAFIGAFLAMLSNKDLLADNSVLNNFCSKKCDVVQNSKKWKIFKFLDFEILSLTYFLTQIVVISLFRNDIYPILAKISYLSYFFVIVSICYQFYIKKICKICLSISAVLLLQDILCYNYLVTQINRGFLSKALFFLGFFFSLFYCIFRIKKYFLNTNLLKREAVNAGKISNNPDYINTLVFNNSKIYPPNLYDTLSPSGKINLFIYTSIACKHCKKLHHYISKIMTDFGDRLDVKFAFFVDLEDSEDEIILIYQKLALILIRGEFKKFYFLLEELYNDYFESINNYIFDPTQEENVKIVKFFAEVESWSNKNNIYYAPYILINNHSFSHEFNYSILYDVIERLAIEHEEFSFLQTT